MTEGTAPRPAEPPSALPRPSVRERWARRPPGLSFLVGVGMLAVYLVAALSALVVFRSSLDQLPSTVAWVPLENPIGPSAVHPFGVMAGFGTDLFRAVWQATPWDLGIVAGILGIDVFLGFFLGAIAGLDEGGLVDALITFVGDSLGSIPTFVLAVVVFAGLLTVAPQTVGLPVFVAVFGIILWPTMARTVRERARIIAHQPYVEGARASGASSLRILVRHVMPNSLGPVLAQIPLDVAPVFFVLSAFPWYYNCQLPGGPHVPVPPGHLAPPPTPYLVPVLPYFSPLPSNAFPEWGFLLGFGTCEGFSFPGGFNYWWMYLFPLLAIVGLGVAIGLVCDGIERWRHFDR
ncbi:MAG: ABC transporter permease subunit [Thermoplasmata archaeon]